MAATSFQLTSTDRTNPVHTLYNLAPNQGEIDPLMIFNLSAYAGAVDSNGSLTMTDPGCAVPFLMRTT
jgi:hypothetical protein